MRSSCARIPHASSVRLLRVTIRRPLQERRIDGRPGSAETQMGETDVLLWRGELVLVRDRVMETAKESTIS